MKKRWAWQSAGWLADRQGKRSEERGTVECLRQEMTIQIKDEAPKKCTNVARRSCGRASRGRLDGVGQVVSVEATTPAYVTFALPLNMKLIMKLLCKILFNEF